MFVAEEWLLHQPIVDIKMEYLNVDSYVVLVSSDIPPLYMGIFLVTFSLETVW